VITTCEGEVSDSRAAAFGWQSVTQFKQIFTGKPGKGSLTLSGSFMNIDNENVVLLNCKKAEDDNGYIIRLWNMSDRAEAARIQFNYMNIGNAASVNIVEEAVVSQVEHDINGFRLVLEKGAVVNVRVTM
jgi:alpha-mannosidase